MATLYILYGSATGNAEHIAKDLASRGPPAPFTKVVCEALEKFKKMSEVWIEPPTVENNRKHGIVIVCSTTGNGDPPENASRFQRYAKRKTTLEAKVFKHCAFAVLGLGDTNYDVFCGAAVSVDKCINDGGGERVRKLVCADEATGLEDTVEPWKDSIFADITKACFSADNAANNSTTTNGSATNGEVKEEKVVKAKPKTAVIAAPKVLDKSLQSESPLFILYGSATGNSEQIAKDLAENYNLYLKNPDVYTYFPSVVLCELNSWRKNCMPTWDKAASHKHGVVIVTSTTGNAEAPENADRFVRWLKRKPTAALMPFQNTTYSIMALGDTNYDVYCATGMLLDKKLGELGGTRAKAIVCADEATGMEQSVDPWVASIFMDITLACQGSMVTADSASSAVDVVAEKPAEKNVPAPKEEEKKMEVDDPVVTPPTPVATPIPAATPVVTATQPTTNITMSIGASTVCSILGLKCDIPLDEVDTSSLPKIGSSLSSCNLLSQLDYQEELDKSALSTADDDRLTVSSASSSAIHYTLKKPFESSIVQAQYLTTTSPDAAKKAADIISSGWMKQEDKNGAVDNESHTKNSALVQQAMDVYSEQFPLCVSDTTNKDTTERNAKRVIELTLSLPDDFTLEYTPGDSLGLIVENLPEAVDFVLGMLERSQSILPDQRVSIDNGNSITVRQALQQEIDLCAPLKNKRVISNLAQHAADAEDRKALLLLASKTPTGVKAFEEFVDKQRLSIVDLLREFPSCQGIPLAALLSILPGIPPRYYSVSSSPLVGQKDLSLTVSFSVVDYVTPSLLDASKKEQGLRRKKGIATRYLEAMASPFLAGNASSCAISTCLRIFPKPTAEFRMPASLATPMVLIGPGTGIAPFMGFLQHRRATLSSMESKEAATSVVEGTWRGGYDMEEEELNITKGDVSGLRIGADFVSNHLDSAVGSVDVFFGCRHADHDWLYRSDMEELKQQGIITQLHTAFSRDGVAATNGSRRKYVQDLMLNDEACATRLQDLILNKNASIFICGDGNVMAKDVLAAVVEVVKRAPGQGDESAKAVVEKMKADKRYLVDIWS